MKEKTKAFLDKCASVLTVISFIFMFLFWIEVTLGKASQDTYNNLTEATSTFVLLYVLGKKS